MVSRVGVVTNVGDTLRVEHFLANCQNAFPDRLRNPGIETVGDNIIKSPESLRTSLADVHRMECYVLQPEVFKIRLSGSDRTACQIQPNKLAGRQLEGHSKEIAAKTATQFEHTTMIDGRRFHSPEESDRG